MKQKAQKRQYLLTVGLVVTSFVEELIREILLKLYELN